MEAGGINMAPAFPVWGHGHSASEIRRDDLPAGGIYNGDESRGGLSNYRCRWTEGGGGGGGKGRRRRREKEEGGGNNPAEAFYLNHSSAPFKSI